MKKHVRRLVIASFLASLSLIATLFFAFPLPVGYANLGDCVVFLCGYTLGGIWGVAAAGVGSALADLLGGFGVYAPATFIIKGFIALCGAFAFKLTSKGKCKIPVITLASAIGEAIMVFGYFFFESAFLGVGAAAVASIPGNLTQAAVGILTSSVLITVFTNNKKLSKILKEI